MRDNLPRRLLKRLALAAFEVDLAFERKWRKNQAPPMYELGGSCQRCARCCEAPAISVSWPFRRFRSLRALFLAWQRHVNRFDLVREDKLLQAFVFRCEHFDRLTRSCDSYETRPGLCRDYPRRLMYQPNPEMLEGCGYRPVAFGAPRMLSALRKQNLTEEQMAKLKKGLFLD
jgi:Fe-S-cluster containining protein